ncbi:MAG: DEAD/DEAH box helicase [Patescibacteria group bacterium]
MAPPRILIASITPYFLEKGSVWFEENLNKILEAKKSQSFFEDNLIYLKQGQACHLSEFLRKLDEMGYEKVLEISYPGEFSQRGGIVDVFPVNQNSAVRLDFLGNKIEDISELPVKIDDEKVAKEILKKRLKSQKLFSDLKGIKPGDYLVHLDHGIAQFLGIEKSEIRNLKSETNSNVQNYKSQTQDYYILGYAEGDKLFVPLGLERKLSRYVGFVEPKISRLGSMTWQQTKKRIKESTEKLAKELLELYAKREIAKRPPYAPDDEIDKKLADGFGYEETPDQIEALIEIKKDLEREKPMDRILCGDVGFGKTEVALRTMMRAAKSGYQSALISPTTILAYQHFQNFKERLKNLPVKIALLSRLQSEKEQKKNIENLKTGQIDILIGTHRVLSKDVEFSKLGLLVIDDEQRFGVKQKEKLKKMRESLDILSLSATPIPRTLYLALSSMKNISLIQTPPLGRLAVKTSILPFSKKIIKDAIINEIKRNGQVYYLHNKIQTIEAVKKYLQELTPDVKFGVGHGRLSEKELIGVMDDFKNKKTDVLIATTIIENGIDLPNVNTMIVDDAVRLGLSQAYQIRGRIGRSHIQAFAYFFYGKRLQEKAKLRLDALKEFEELGSGYKIALRDLEIRGAGNILGKEQSGSINRVGLNLYCQILSEAVEKLKNFPR